MQLLDVVLRERDGGVGIEYRLATNTPPIHNSEPMAWTSDLALLRYIWMTATG